MNLYHRIAQVFLMIVLILLLIVTGIYFFGWAPKDVYVQAFSALYSNLWAAGVALVLFLLTIWIITPYFIESRPAVTLIHKGENGQAWVSLHAIEGLVQRVAADQQGIKGVQTALRVVPEGVKVMLRLEVSPELDIPQMVGHLQAMLKDYIIKTTGVNISEVEVVVRSITPAVVKQQKEDSE